MKTITANQLSNVNGGAATASRPGTQNGATIWNPPAPQPQGQSQNWSSTSWGKSLGETAGRAAGSWWGK
jgi:bacteriocin-like protein